MTTRDGMTGPFWSRFAGLFAFGAALRLAFWLATGDRAAPAAAAYEGDAPKWLSFVGAPAGEIQLALPFQPPGMIWLTDALTDGASFGFARATLALLGALVAPLVYTIVRRDLPERAALLAGGLCAAATNLVLLGSGLHSDVPYLLLLLVGMLALPRLRDGRASLGAAAWFGASQALACFFRVDHLVFVALVLVWLLAKRRRAALLPALVLVGAMALVFAPYQLHGAAQVARANEHGFPGRPPAALPLPSSLAWDDDALAAVRAMPAFARTAAFAFVDHTIARRGGRRVRRDDLRVLDEAYGTRPEPLRTPLLAMYGPMNFALANHPSSRGGFTRAAFDDRPPLEGGLDRYPPWLAPVLEPNGPLRWDYPPHLELINHGYRVGLARLRDDPAWAAGLIADKLVITWRGVATGFGGYGLPVGLSGVRPAVDLVAPDGVVAALWRAALLLLAGAGLWFGRRGAAAPAVVPWIAFAASKFAAAALFFGYARFGALCIPAFALLWAIALDVVVLRRFAAPALRRAAFVAVGLLLALEVARCVAAPAPELQRLDGASPPSGAVLGRDEAVRVRY